LFTASAWKRLSLATLASVLAGAATYATACDSSAVSLGNALTFVATDVISVGVGVCSEARYAHPNVCCQATTSPATCGTYPMSPFAPCPASYALYPDPRTCCSLDDPDPSLCIAALSASSSSASTCGYACAPGAGTTCTAAAPALACSEPACIAGETCVTSCPSVCGACPTGFTVPDGGAALCYRADSGVGTEWFSQALGLAASVGVSVATPPSADASIVLVDAGTTTTVTDGGVMATGVDGSLVFPDATLTLPPAEAGSFLVDAGFTGGDASISD
jgi:hypothetical protein